MSTQVARIGGQLLQDNLQRELADLAFDTDLLVVKRDNTLGIATTTTPRNLSISGTMRTTSGGSDPDIVFGNSLKVGDFTLASSGISTASGDITIKSTHPNGYIKTAGIGSNNFAVKGDGIQALQTNGGIGIRPEALDGSTAAWNSDGNYGNYWSPGPKVSASSPPNDMDRLYDYAISLAQSGSWTTEELNALDYDGDGDIDVQDALQLKNMNTQFVGGVAYPATRTLADHNNTTAFKAYIEKYYPASVPQKLQIQSGGTVTVTGNIHATGNITYGGTTLTIGDDSTDTANFFADFHDNITPDLDNVYHLGKDFDSTGPKKGFLLAVQNLNADTVATKGITYQGINLTKNNGILYVSNGNGSDANEGYSPGGPYATITKALSQATAGTFIYIYPGTYQEAFPMTVPAGVTIQGDSIRSVEVMPTSATQSNDAFLLNSDTTIENITIKDFYYDSGNDKGYAFRLANNYNIGIVEQVIGRSPYLRNITVLTKGSSTSASDPRGYDSGDAGRGALIDGSVAVQNSRSASALFHAVTFITPGQVGLTAKSGVRVEWLNSFTYFASTGIKLEQGSGRTAPDGSTVYGAELRSIASACVYGNKGLEADGANNLAYLVNQNFAYIGAGKNVTNDNTLTVRANEVVKSNNAKVYYTTQDQRGNFRVGDNFLVDLENERTSFDVESIFAQNATAQIREGNNTITLQPGLITQNEIAIQGNSIEAFRGNLNFNSTGNIVFQGNVTAPNITTTGNLTIGGSLTSLGDSPTDTVDFNTPISQNFVPGSSETKALGTPTKRWNEVNSETANVNTISIGNGQLKTNETNAHLFLEPKNSGKVVVSNLNFKSNIVSSSTGDIVFQPTTELKIDSTGELRLPKGETAQRPAVQGGIRFNTNFNGFEGTETSGPVSLQGIYDSDRDTYLDLSNNQFNFVTAGQTNHTLNGILLESKGFSSDGKTSIDGNTISTDQQDGTFQLKSNGTGKTIIGDLQFQTNDLFNNSNNNFIINHTNNNGLAYLKIENVNGMIPPTGTSAQRPGSPEIGTTRYNTDASVNYVETWNGSAWINAAGNVASIDTDQVEALAYVYNLILD
tara:strand:- start:10541 stop:13777 length:3237 start_codon:yes stop_codon:yes gene_type:complete